MKHSLYLIQEIGTAIQPMGNWIKFFRHRKYGYNIILLNLIDRQIRSLEYEVAHMKISNFFAIVPISAFMCVTRGMVKN